MLYFRTTQEKTEVVDPKFATIDHADPTIINRNDFKTLADAEKIAEALGTGYIATDAGAHVSPRYDVIALPKVGDEVSYAFNGDCYPCGKIVRISDGPNFFRITAEEQDATSVTGVFRHSFYRRRLTGSWIMDGTWSLVLGHVSKRNPEF